ncbi:MAG: 3,4-dihydroxy-2-butanone-4-phosphate synthase [Acidilobaceae archaeon]
MALLREVGEALESGLPIVIYDFEEREGEADLVYPAWVVGVDEVYELRAEAGGLVCYVTEGSLARSLGIPWAYELIGSWSTLSPLASRTLRYGDRPAFTIWVNHVSVKTGISDEDRSVTIRELDGVSRLYYSGRVSEAREKFYSEFVAPGHVPILASKSLRERRGHTELSVALFKLVGLRPSAAFAEILVKGRSATYEEARELALKKRIPIVRGSDILKWCESSEVCWSS